MKYMEGGCLCGSKSGEEENRRLYPTIYMSVKAESPVSSGLDEAEQSQG